MVWPGGGKQAASIGVGFDNERSLDDFDDVVERIVYALDEGAADVEVDAAGEEKQQNGGDGGVPEGEAATGGLEHVEMASGIGLTHLDLYFARSLLPEGDLLLAGELGANSSKSLLW